MSHMKKQSGFTLTELIIATALGITLSAGVIEIYSSSKQTYRSQEALSRLQENARFAIDIISRDIRNSGFIGCSRISETAIQGQATTGLNYDEEMAIWGKQSTGDNDPGDIEGGYNIPSITNIIENSRYGDTDVLVVQGTSGCSVKLASDMSDATGSVNIASNACGFQQNDHVLVSNCGTADVFQITSDPSSNNSLTHTDSPTLSTAYLSDGFTEVFPFYSNTYFIGSEVQPDGSEMPSLVVVDNTEPDPTTVALVEGVESMQLQYGIDTNNDGFANIYLNAEEVGTYNISNFDPSAEAIDWSKVSAVRVTLLLRTIENVGSGAEVNFTLGGDEERTFNEGRPIRQQFVSTIQLRNRG
ncbi:MAG: PilW family protein [Agarilytica sp.]